MGLFGFDIETDTTINGLDPTVAEIVSIAVWSHDAGIVIDGGTERERIGRLLNVFDNYPATVAVSWNGAVFDIGFIETRARLAGISTGFSLVADPTIVPKYEFLPGHGTGYRAKLGKHRHADMAYAYHAYALGHPGLGRAGWSLKPVCRSLGIDMIKVDASAIHLLSAEENAAYNLSDSRGTCLLAERLGDDLEHWVDRV